MKKRAKERHFTLFFALIKKKKFNELTNSIQIIKKFIDYDFAFGQKASSNYQRRHVNCSCNDEPINLSPSKVRYTTYAPMVNRQLTSP